MFRTLKTLSSRTLKPAVKPKVRWMDMSRKVLLTMATIMPIVIALLIAAPIGAVTADSELSIHLQYYNGTAGMLDLANEIVTVKVNDSVFKNVQTNGTGWLTLSIPYAPTDNVMVEVWWNASWGVSYYVNYTALQPASNFNGSSISCSIYNVNYKPLDVANAVLPHAKVKIMDRNASVTMYEIDVGADGLTGNIKLPVDLAGTRYYTTTVLWTPTTPITLVKVYNVTGNATAYVPTDSATTSTAGSVVLPCSVYYITYDGYYSYIEDLAGILLHSQGDLTIFACIYSNGTLMSTQSIIEEGGTVIRVATVAEDDNPGAGNLFDYEFRIYWRWETPSLEYLIYWEKNTFGTISGNISSPPSITANAVTTIVKLLDKSGDPLALSDVSITFPIYDYTLSTSTGTSGSDDGCVDWSAIIGTSWWWYAPDEVPLPAKHNDTVLTYRITATYESITVLDETFAPIDYSTWSNRWGVPMLELECSVYWVSFELLDYHGRNLEGNAMLTVTYPSEGVEIGFLIVGGIGGRRLPGGSGLTAVIDYKDVYDIAPLEPTSFNINDTSTTITLKFPIYDLMVYVYDYYNKTIVEDLNGTIDFAGGLWPTQVAWYNATGKYHLFKQLPANGSYAVKMYTRSDGGTPGFDAPAARGKFMGSATVKMPNSDLETNISIPLYNPRIVIKAADGSELPQELKDVTWIVVGANTTSTTTYFLNNTVDITYESNQSLGICFVGGWAYPLRVYVGGVLVYEASNGYVLPDPSDGVIALNVNVYPSTATVWTYSGNYPIPGLVFKLQWSGVNISNFASSPATLMTSTWSTYYSTFKSVGVYGFDIMLYNATDATTNADGEVTFYVPVWDLAGFNYTTIRYGIYTQPGVTPGVPSDVPEVLVIHKESSLPGSYIEGKLMNISKAQDIGDIYAYAYDFHVKVINYLNQPLSNYNVSINGTWTCLEVKEYLASTLTDASGIAHFISGENYSGEQCFFFGNYTYYVYAFNVVDGEDAVPQIVSDLKSLFAGSWDHDTTLELKFKGALILEVVDQAGVPLHGAKVELYWATEPCAGKLTILGYTDENGFLTFYMSNTSSSDVYALKVWWKDQLVYLQNYLSFLDDVWYYPRIYTQVFNPVYIVVSDSGEKLPPEHVSVEVTWPNGEVGVYSLDENSAFMLKQAPIGNYSIVVLWDDVIRIYSSTRWLEYDERVELECSVYSVELKILTPAGVPLAGADVEVLYPDGRTESYSLDDEGKVLLPLVAVDDTHNTLTIESVTWMGVSVTPANNVIIVDRSMSETLYASNIYKVTISVVGSSGQPLGGAAVSVWRGNELIKSIDTDQSGSVTIELPAGTYNVVASFLGKKAEKTITVSQDTSETISLDVFIVIGNQAFSTGEVILWIVIAIIVIIVLAAIIIFMSRIGRKPAVAAVEK